MEQWEMRQIVNYRFLFGEIFARGNNDDPDRPSWNGNPGRGNEKQQERESSSFLPSPLE